MNVVAIGRSGVNQRLEMPSDELDRDKMYSAPADDAEDDAELELEPLDPELLAAEKRRAAEALEAHRDVIDIDAVYRDMDAARESELLKHWIDRIRDFRYRFQLRHLFIATAVVAVLIGLSRWTNLGTMLIVAVMLAVAGVTLLLKLEENKRQEEADRRRQEMYAERRARLARRSGRAAELEEEQ